MDQVLRHRRGGQLADRPRLGVEAGRAGRARCRRAPPRWRAAAPGSGPCVAASVFLRAWSKSSRRPSGLRSSSELLEVRAVAGWRRRVPRRSSAKSRTWWRNAASGSSASASPILSAALPGTALPGRIMSSAAAMPDPPRQPHAAAPARDDPEPGLGQPDAHVGAVAHHDVGRGERPARCRRRGRSRGRRRRWGRGAPPRR